MIGVLYQLYWVSKSIEKDRMDIQTGQVFVLCLHVANNIESRR